MILSVKSPLSESVADGMGILMDISSENYFYVVVVYIYNLILE